MFLLLKRHIRMNRIRLLGFPYLHQHRSKELPAVSILMWLKKTGSCPRLMNRLMFFPLQKRGDCDAGRADGFSEGELCVERLTAPRRLVRRRLSPPAARQLRQWLVHHDMGPHYRCTLLCLWQEPRWCHHPEGHHWLQVYSTQMHSVVNATRRCEL